MTDDEMQSLVGTMTAKEARSVRDFADVRLAELRELGVNAVVAKVQSEAENEYGMSVADIVKALKKKNSRRGRRPRREEAEE